MLLMMTNLFSKTRVFICFSIFLVLTGCTVPIKEEQILSEEKELKKFIGNNLRSDEALLHSEPVHFHLRRWDSNNSLTGETSYRCDNDLLVVTSKRLYIVENYRPIEEHMKQRCSSLTGSSVLRPHKVYSYLLSSINEIKIHDSHQEIETEISITFSPDNTESPTRIYLGFLHPAFSTTIERKRQSIARFNAINQNFNVPISKEEKCTLGVKDECSGPGANNTGPFWSCLHADDKFFQERPFWLLYMKDGWHWDMVFKIPHQWCCVFPRSQYKDCPDDIDLWSSNKEIATTLDGANDAHVLYIGDERSDGACFQKYLGYWSYKEYTIENCEENWYQVGGRRTGPCKNMNGTKVRRYVVGAHNCFLYDKVDGLMTIDEYYGR
jgi:hypothetical protein